MSARDCEYCERDTCDSDCAFADRHTPDQPRKTAAEHRADGAGAARAALLALLDAVDYTKGACGIAEPIGGVLPVVLIEQARRALS